ncbi:AfsA-related hotdog domain-containing protein [Nocardia cyriacigeorgica]|uniref:AfsA-related hotdog domain-containing protein n=1 Tax=Nocardia cyriacigeorgica TaxID=135487 RepID=UPI002458B5F9|nr:AfsA-related hotdog domain-containing protein [Nocardia cyriacigeorgica]
MTQSTRPAPPALTFDQTVPRALAHRRALGEVFVADSVAEDESTFRVAVQIPRAHSLWYDRRTTHHDPFAMAEAARQGSFVVLHRHVGVPLALPFSMQRYEFAVTALDAFHDDERAPMQGIIHYRIVSRQDRGPDFANMTLAGELLVDDVPAMTLEADAVFLSRTDYEALRSYQLSRVPNGPAHAAVPPLPPAAVGRLDSRNVVIGEPQVVDGDPRYPLLPDPRHPALFDHDYDHVPGPFLIEAFRQASIDSAVRAGRLASPITAVGACSARFINFAEFGAPLECRAVQSESKEPGCVRVEVELRQFDRVLADGAIELIPMDGHRSSFPDRTEVSS